MSSAVRPATLADAPELARLFTALGYHTSEADLARRATELLRHPDHLIAVMENDSGGLTGCLHAQLHRTLGAELAAVIVAMVVDGTLRRRGFGRSLMCAAEDWAKKNGCLAVLLRTNTVRPDAPAFYESLGYLRTKTQAAYRKSLADQP